MINNIYRKSQLTGNTNSMELALSEFDIKIRNCKTDNDLKNEFQFLSFVERRFLLTGITLEEDIENLNNHKL